MKGLEKKWSLSEGRKLSAEVIFLVHNFEIKLD
jgi:hypothetical protein